MVVGLTREQLERNKLPRAKARYGFNNRIVVDKCPYCGKTHYHGMGPVGETSQRLAECFQGEYILNFSEENKNG